MTVPWFGFQMSALLDLARPLAAARYVEMHTFSDPEVAPGQRQAWYPWPYLEGLTIEEAANELTFLAIGIYGKPLPKQNGAPLRLAVPGNTVSNPSSRSCVCASPMCARARSGIGFNQASMALG
jgi:sulfoxide reductase catalytic subunit YedY